MDTTQTSTFANLSSGWTTPSGSGLHLTDTFEVDNLGRTTKSVDAAGRITYIVYKDTTHEVRVYPGWDSATNTTTGPIQVIREDRAAGYTETFTMATTPSVSGGKPTGTESITNIQSLSRQYKNEAGQLVTSDAYFNLTGLTYTTSTTLGTENTHFYRTTFRYDNRGRQNRVVRPTGTIERTVYDGLDRVISTWIGTNDTGATNTDPTGGGASGNNMFRVSLNEYDNAGIGDSNLTKTTLYPGGSAANRVSTSWFDWRNRMVGSKSGVETSESTSLNRQLSYLEYNNLDQVTTQEQYDGDGVTLTDSNSDGVPDKPSSSLLRAKSTMSYDELGRAFRTEIFNVNQSTGAVSSNSLKSDTWFDLRGNVIKTSQPGGIVSKSVYDGAGRLTKSYTTDGGSDTTWTHASNVTGDVVLQQSEMTYDASGLTLSQTLRRRFHDETGTGELGTATTGVKSRVSYAGMWYDLAGRMTDSVDVGTNGGTAWTRPGSVPARSDTALVSSQSYDTAGRVESVTDPKGLISKSFYDALRRTTKVIENYVDGTPSNADDKTVEFTYDGSGNRKTLKVYLAGGGYQTTEWIYGVNTTTGSDIASNDIVSAMRYPDKTTGNASSSEQETYTVNALGEMKASTDRNGTVHTFTRDVLGRLISDAVTTVGSGVDGTIRRIDTAYDTAGRAYLHTSYDATSGGNIVNQIQQEHNGLGQLTREYQAVSGAVNTSTTPFVAYTYSEMSGGANHSRLVSMTYPNGRVLNYDYGSGYGQSWDNSISRLTAITDSSGLLENMDYLGLDTVVQRWNGAAVGLTFTNYWVGGTADAGDQYTGLDRFDRIVDLIWYNSDSDTLNDRFLYGYDRNSNRLYRENALNSIFSELYQYDGLNQLTSMQRGQLNGTKTAITGTPSRSQSWTFDALGNFTTQVTDGTTETRTHNRQNQITSISGLTAPVTSANGEMTTDEQGRTLKYDAWGRLVEVKQGSTVLSSHSHDVLNRKITEGSRALYYSADWQVVEERESGLVVVQTVFSPVYVDAMILRDRDTDANGTLDQRLWLQQDANFNVTAITNGSTVVERFIADAYGTPTILTAAWAARSATLYAWVHLHQGGRRDAATGMFDFRNRWLSPSLGRWNRKDPIGFLGGDANLARAIGNRGHNSLDPLGLAEGCRCQEGPQAMPFIDPSITAWIYQPWAFETTRTILMPDYFSLLPQWRDGALLFPGDLLLPVQQKRLDVFGINIRNASESDVLASLLNSFGQHVIKRDGSLALDRLGNAFWDGMRKAYDPRVSISQGDLKLLWNSQSGWLKFAELGGLVGAGTLTYLEKGENVAFQVAILNKFGKYACRKTKVGELELPFDVNVSIYNQPRFWAQRDRNQDLFVRWSDTLSLQFEDRNMRLFTTFIWSQRDWTILGGVEYGGKTGGFDRLVNVYLQGR